MRSIPVVMSVAGSDNSSGAGIQADLKTMSALRVYGVTAVTCVVAEVPGKVTSIQAVEPAIVAEQMRLLYNAFPIAAIKTGMLHSASTLRAVCGELSMWRQVGGRCPIVVDPVMVASSGDALMQQDALAEYTRGLLPMADLVTPNLDEVAVLWGQTVRGLDGMRDAGRQLRERYRTAFLIKGGHLGEKVAADLLVEEDGTETWFEAPFVEGVATHGTGCTYSAAIASALGRGMSLRAAVAMAKEYVSAAIQGHLRWKSPGDHSPVDALDHFPHAEFGRTVLGA
jgi:hydroxymethylpyrimidine/phosphomethylpyrimidine kinase